MKGKRMEKRREECLLHRLLAAVTFLLLLDFLRFCVNVCMFLHDCVDRSCVCQLSLNEYMMTMIR